MSNLTFLFSYGLWALPLAGLPVVLHFLFRRKSPVIQFSTLRFIKTSVQRTAARRRLHRWLLLGCRVLLLALLIWAISQPARRVAGAWFGGNSGAAVLVVDTSYSMELLDHQTSLLSRADDAIDQLLRGSLQNARVAIFKSQPAAIPETFQSASAIQANWRALEPQPAAAPLVDRVAVAAQLLSQQSADHKWLVVLSDLQRREFPRELPTVEGAQTILIDLHPSDQRAAAIAGIQAEPAQPRLGIASQIAMELAGKSGDSQAINLAIAPAENPTTPIAHPSLPMARFTAAGRAVVRVPFTFDAQSWLLMTATLPAPGELPWAAGRTQLAKVAPPAHATLLNLSARNSLADAIVRLALDPGQGTRAAWPIALRSSSTLSGDENVVVACLTQWPSQAAGRQWADHVRGGGTLMLFLQPGLEDSWKSLPPAQQEVLQQILPGAPVFTGNENGPFSGAVARPNDPLLADVGDPQSASGKLLLRRIVPLENFDSTVQTILFASAANGVGRPAPHPLLARKMLGTGQIYTWATFPTPQYGNLATYELFLPLLVNSAGAGESETQSLNVEVGNRIVLPLSGADKSPVELAPASGAPYQINLTSDSKGARYISEPANTTGLYVWKRAGQVISYTQVQYPAEEARLEYRAAAEIAPPGPNIIVASSIADLEEKMHQAAEPQAKWSLPIALVMFLLCLEAMMGSLSNLWKSAERQGGKPNAPTAVQHEHVVATNV